MYLTFWNLFQYEVQNLAFLKFKSLYLLHFHDPYIYIFLCLTAHNWQNWKRVFLTCPCYEIYKDESKKLQIYLKNYDVREYVEFGAISWNFDILSITA